MAQRLVVPESERRDRVDLVRLFDFSSMKPRSE
jgi:hypothetical protein